MSAIRNLSVAAGFTLLALAAPALAQSGRTIKLVNPFPAGGTADIWARILGEQVGRERGVSVVIENRPGGGTVIATEAFSRTAPDGNNMLVVGNSFTINPSVRKLNYDPLTSFEPICYLVSSPSIVVVTCFSRMRKVPVGVGKSCSLSCGLRLPDEMSVAKTGFVPSSATSS